MCKITEFAAANDSSGFPGNTILLQCENNEYVYISGLEIFKKKPDDKILDYTSLMGNNMCPYAIMIGERLTYFKSYHYKFFENDKVEDTTFLNTINGSLDPFDYRLKKYGRDVFKTLEHSLFHSFWPGVGEDTEDEDYDLVEEDDLVEENEDLIETEYFNGNNEVVKLLIKDVLLVWKEILFMHLDIVVINVFVSNVIKIKVILIN